MTTFLLLLVINSLIIWGFHYSCWFDGADQLDAAESPERAKDFRKTIGINQNGEFINRPENRNIFWRVRWELSVLVDKFYLKPVYLCPMCMSSLHGFLPFVYVYGLTTETIFIYPFYVLALAGLNVALSHKVFND